MSSDPTVEDRVGKIVARVLSIDPNVVSTATRSGHESWTSLAHVEIVFGIEDEFDCDLDPDDLAMAESVADLVELVDSIR